MKGIVNLCLISSFTATSPNKYPRQRVSITFWLENYRLSLCLTCQIITGIGKIGTFLSKGRSGYADLTNGQVFLMGLIILGESSRSLVSRQLLYPG